jgi:hypothetical protein
LILKQITTIAAGHPFRGKIPEKLGTGVYAVQMKDVSLRDGINWGGCVETELQGRRDDWLQSGDILVAARGSHNYAILVDLGPLGRDQNAVAAPHFFVLRIRGGSILPEFLVWLLNQTTCQRYFEQNAEGTLTKSIRRTVLEETPIALPPLARQTSIVGLANTLKREQQALEKLIRNGEKLLTAIADDLLTQSHVDTETNKSHIA